VKIAQELLRHANSRITLDIYQQTVTEERRAAQVPAFSGILAESSANNGSVIFCQAIEPLSTQKGLRKNRSRLQTADFEWDW
jgi:hypothetical protein